MCSPLHVIGTVVGVGLFAKGRMDAKRAEKAAEKRSEELQESLASREEIQSDVVEGIESATDSDLERRKRRRLGKRALRSVGLQGISPAPTQSPSPSLGGIQ